MRNLELRQALYAALRAYAPLVALLADDPLGGAAIYDHTPQDAEFPYLVIGGPDGVEHDTDSSLGWDAEVSIHSFARYRGYETVEAIQRETDDAINRTEPSVTDGRIVTLHRTECRSILDDDGLTRHGIHRFRAIIEEL